MTDIPGLKAVHAVITPNCRVVQGGEDEAFTVATERLREEYLTILRMREDRVHLNFHLVLTVEKKVGRSKVSEPSHD